MESVIFVRHNVEFPMRWLMGDLAAYEEQPTGPETKKPKERLTIWSFTVFPSSSIVRILKSTPMVLI